MADSLPHWHAKETVSRAELTLREAEISQMGLLTSFLHFIQFLGLNTSLFVTYESEINTRLDTPNSAHS